MKNTTITRLPDGKLEIIIPKLSTQYVKSVAERVRYFVPETSTAFDISSIDLENHAFTWCLKEAVATRVESVLEPVLITDAYHTYGYYGLFKPSFLEVVASLPEEMVDAVRFFSLQGPKTADDLTSEMDVTNAGFHHSKVTWYK